MHGRPKDKRTREKLDIVLGKKKLFEESFFLSESKIKKEAAHVSFLYLL
jgi:hypothetical protein